MSPRSLPHRICRPLSSPLTFRGSRQMLCHVGFSCCFVGCAFLRNGFHTRASVLADAGPALWLKRVEAAAAVKPFNLSCISWTSLGRAALARQSVCGCLHASQERRKISLPEDSNVRSWCLCLCLCFVFSLKAASAKPRQGIWLWRGLYPA